ncbi:MAG: hypothetical protein KDE53_25580, partial [Caldilineaceae bacterium]|nr:hypothetical protein [Caldilineaceae bacterium]
ALESAIAPTINSASQALTHCLFAILFINFVLLGYILGYVLVTKSIIYFAGRRCIEKNTHLGRALCTEGMSKITHNDMGDAMEGRASRTLEFG